MSPAEISSLFVIWSVTAFALEIPSGAWADAFSRRRLLIIGPLLSGAGYALWTYLPSYPAFALGFVLWGAQGALRSGALQALVYEDLAAANATDRYASIIGRSRAVGAVALLGANALAAPVFAAGGYLAVGTASVAACAAMATVGASFHERRARPAADAANPAGWSTYVATLTSGFSEVRRRPQVRRALLLAAGLVGFDALDEYLPLAASETVGSTTSVALLVTIIAVGEVVGAWYAGRTAGWPTRRLGGAVILAAAALAIGAGSQHAAGFVLLAGVFAVLEIATVVADTRLQNAITGSARATITSVAGFGVEVTAIMVYVIYAAGSTIAGPGPLLAAFAAPLLVVGVVLVRGFRRSFAPSTGAFAGETLG